MAGDAATASLIAAWWGAGTGSLALLINWLNRRDAKKKEKQQISTAWSLRLVNLPAYPSEPAFSLILRDPGKARYRLIEVCAIEPSRTLLAFPAQRTLETGKAEIFVAEPYAKVLTVNQDLKGDVHRSQNGEHCADVATFRFFAKPDRPPAKPARLVLRTTVEAISSSAESQKVLIRSEPVDWTHFHDFDEI